MKKVLFSVLVVISCVSCSSEDIEVQTQPEPTSHLISISNDDKPFEYWLDKEYYSSSTPVSLIVPSNTQITIGAIVEVRNNVEILPNIQVYHNNKLVTLRQVTKSFFIYRIL